MKVFGVREDFFFMTKLFVTSFCYLIKWSMMDDSDKKLLFFFLSFNLWRLFFIITLYHQNKKLINWTIDLLFNYQRFYLELTRTYYFHKNSSIYLYYYKNWIFKLDGAHSDDTCPFLQTYHDDTSSLLKTKKLTKRFY